MEITWQVSDGYAGPARPQRLKIKDDEIVECDTEQEAVDLIEGYIQESFSEKVSPSYDLEKIKAQVKTLFASKPVERATDDAEGG